MMPISGGFLGGSVMPVQYNGQSFLPGNMSTPIDAKAYMANAISAPGTSSIVGGIIDGAGGVPSGGTVSTQPVGQPIQFNNNPAGQNQFSTPYMANGLPQTGLIGSEQALQSGFNAAGQSIEQGLNQATQTLSPYTQGGSGAFDYQAALSGAMGPEAQAQAYAGYMESPGQSYLREQGEKSITRNAAATGGLQGGNVLQELQRHGIGLAAQDFNDSFNRLGQLSGMGLNASQSLGGMQFGAGNRIGDYAYGTGQALSGGRTRAGEQIAGAIGDTTSSLANLINQQGTALSAIEGAAGGNFANILARAGEGDSAAIAQLQTLLANISTGSASQVAGLSGIPGTQATPGILGGLGDLAGGVGLGLTGLAAAGIIGSDRRLKKNITHIGQTPGGTNIYKWDWNEDGMRLFGNQATVGVIAQEVPEASIMGDHGFLMVDYGRVA